MRRVKLTPEIAREFPEAEIRLVSAVGLLNSRPWAEADALTAQAEEAVRAGAADKYGEDSEYIASWHSAYRAFGTNPKRFRPSVDALLRRVRKTGSLPRISPAVDTYNAVSVLCGLPAGAFDVDRVSGDIAIRFAAAGDRFEPLGEPGEWEDVRPGEAVYADAETVLTRHWNHRDCDKTMLRPDSHNAVFLLERVSDKVAAGELHDAARRLADVLVRHASRVDTHVLTRDRDEIVLP